MILPLSLLTYVTTNKLKAKEFGELGFDVKILDQDIPEVMGTQLETICHKAISQPERHIVEDSIVMIDGKDIVDWKDTYKQHAVHGKEFTWKVSMAYCEGDSVYVYMTSLLLRFHIPEGMVLVSSNFDPYSVIPGWPETIEQWKSELANTYDWQEACPRTFLANEIRNENTPKYIIPKSMITPWTGEYQ